MIYPITLHITHPITFQVSTIPTDNKPHQNQTAIKMHSVSGYVLQSATCFHFSFIRRTKRTHRIYCIK